MDNLRVTVINKDGEVMFDNLGKTPSEFNNHLTRQEIKQAIKKGSGFDISRISESVGGKFFYSAKYYDDLGIIIRSALPYNINLARDLKADSHYIWFALIISLVLIGIFYSFTHKLGLSIKQLQQFAMKADRNEPIDNDIQRAFPRNDYPPPHVARRTRSFHQEEKGNFGEQSVYPIHQFHLGQELS